MYYEKSQKPEFFLSLMGVTPADNHENIKTACHVRSNMAVENIKNVFDWRRILTEMSRNPFIFGPLSFLAAGQKLVLDLGVIYPMQVCIEYAVRQGLHPDPYIQKNLWIERNYASLLYELCEFFVKKEKFSFDEEKLLWAASEGGERFLREYMEKFSELEKQYNSLGLTRLKAMKGVLKCLLMVITGIPLEDRSDWSFSKKEDTPQAYMERIRSIVLNLYLENAFDFISYADRITSGKIGCSTYNIVEGSKIHSAVLRYYPLPEGVEPNGKVILLVTPLINKPEIFDLARGKSVVEGLLLKGFMVYLVDYGVPGVEESYLGLDFYGKTVPDRYIEIIKGRHPGQEIQIMAYCMGGTLMLPYLSRRAEELRAEGKPMDIKKAVFMASPSDFDDAGTGHKPMRDVIRRGYDADLMATFFGRINVPSEIIELGMQEIQPGVAYYLAMGTYGRAVTREGIRDSAEFLYWLHHGTPFPGSAHPQWIRWVFMENRIEEGKFSLPSRNFEFDGIPPRLGILKEEDVAILDYTCGKDVIAPAGSCQAHKWGNGGSFAAYLEPAGHIFVVSKTFLAHFLELVNNFFSG